MAHSLEQLARVTQAQGDPAAALPLYDECLALWRAMGNQVRVLWIALRLIHAASDVGEYGQAHALVKECLARCQQEGDVIGEADVRYAMGKLLSRQGDLAGARKACEESLALLRQVPRPPGALLGTVLLSLGRAMLREGNRPRAAAHFRESLRLAQDVKHQFIMAFSLLGLASVAAEQQPDLTTRLLGAAETWLKAATIRLPAVDQAEQDEYVATTRAHLGEVAFAAAWAEGKAMTLEQIISVALTDAPALPEALLTGSAGRHTPPALP
jgi:tetratricopeptide (TPR) repeat protein